MGNKTEILRVRLDKKQAVQFEEKADRENTTRSILVRKWIDEYLYNKKDGNP